MSAAPDDGKGAWTAPPPSARGRAAGHLPTHAWARRFQDIRSQAHAPQVIATDLDGTLLRDDQSLSERTQQTLADAVEAGMQVILVTARPPRWVDHLASMVGADGIVLCANGAFVYDVREHRVIEEHTIAAELVLELVADLRERLPGIVFGFERAEGLALEPGYTSDYPLPAAATRGPADQLLDSLPGKLLARCPGMPDEEFQHTVTQVIGARAHVQYSGAVGLAEIGAPGVTKAAALARWTAGHQVAAEQVWAFGDMPNDLPMIDWSGVGVAVANAHRDLLARADLVCPSNEEDGVAQVVRSLLDWVG